MTTTTSQAPRRWYLGAMNDALFILDRPPSASGTDVPPGVYSGDPELALPVWPLERARAQAIVDAHNMALRLAADYGMGPSA